MERQTPEVITSSDYRLPGPVRQRQRRPVEAQVAEMATKYEAGATVYELAAEFGCHRTTVAERLKKAGVAIRLRSPAPGVVDEMARLYGSGLSMVSVGAQVGYCASTVYNQLRAIGVETENTHGRKRKV